MRIREFARPFFLFILIAQAALASESSPHLALSPTTRLEWNEKLGATVQFLPSMGGFYLLGSYETQPVKLWAKRVAPPTIANATSLKRIWSENLKTSQSTGDMTAKEACRKVASAGFVCEREGRDRQGQHFSEQLVWFGKEDLVVLRSTSKASLKSAQGAMSQARIVRGPAGAER